MLTARDEEVDRILGLSIGADDYVVKPFSPRELVARIRALLRRARLPRDTALPSGLSLDVASRRVTVDGQETHLTNLEYAILVALAEVPGVVLTRPQLLAAGWGDDFVGDDHVLDVHVGNLRRKLADDPSAPRFVETVRGVGFRLVTA
jgi:DNA-binding response OmpR family regulator